VCNDRKSEDRRLGTRGHRRAVAGTPLGSWERWIHSDDRARRNSRWSRRLSQLALSCPRPPHRGDDQPTPRVVAAAIVDARHERRVDARVPLFARPRL